MSSRFIRPCALCVVAVILIVAPLAWGFAATDGDEQAQGGRNTRRRRRTYSILRNSWSGRRVSLRQPNSPLIIGVVGTDPFGGLLEEQVQDQRINDRTVMVRHIESMEELRKCHIVFVCRSEAVRLGPILSEVRGDNVLTVGETRQVHQPRGA